MLSFKEFVDFENPIDVETKQTLIDLSESHPMLRNHATIRRIVTDKNAHIPLGQVVQLNQSILQRSTQLAREAATAAEKQHFLILAEMMLLNTASATISSAISAKMQVSVERLSKIAKTAR